MADVNFKFDKTFKIKGTKEFSGELKVSFNQSVKLEGAEEAKSDAIVKEFNKIFDKNLQTQISHFDKFLKEKQATYDEVSRKIEDAKKVTDLKSEAGMKKLASALKDLAAYEKKFAIEKFHREFDEIVDSWSKNVGAQQGEVALLEARQKIMKKEISKKKVRMALGKIAKGTLFVAATVGGIVAIVASAGTAAPLVLGLTITAAALSASAGGYGLYKNIAKDWSVDEKILKSVESDFEVIKSALNPLKKTNFGKHATELDAALKNQQSALSDLKMKLKKTKIDLVKHEKNHELMVKAHAVNYLAEKSDVKRAEKDLKGSQSELDGILKQLTATEQYVYKGQKLIEDMKAMQVKVDEFAKFHESSTIGGNLKEYVTKPAKIAELAKSLGAFRPSAGLAK